jgi:hypothetical protein
MTYESASEAEVLKSYWRPGVPLENTLFIILDPYGRPLMRGARGPEMFFRDASDMASAMNEISSHYRSTSDPQALPAVLTVRLGMNVAACDKLPLAIVVSDNGKQRERLERTLAPLSWSQEFIGRLTYTAGSKYDLRSLDGARDESGYVFVAPNEFGTAGTVVAQLGPDATPAQLQTAMQNAIANYHPLQLDHREHIRWGKQQGIQWQSAIPITDPQALQAERMRPPFGSPGNVPPNPSRY